MWWVSGPVPLALAICDALRTCDFGMSGFEKILREGIWNLLTVNGIADISFAFDWHINFQRGRHIFDSIHVVTNNSSLNARFL